MSLVLDGTNGITMPVGSQSNASIVAWVNFNGTNGASPVIRASYNITSVTRNSTGTYTIVMTNAIQDINYSVIASSSPTGTNASYPPQIFSNTQWTTLTPTTTTFSVITPASTTNLADPLYICLAVIR